MTTSDTQNNTVRSPDLTATDPKNQSSQPTLTQETKPQEQTPESSSKATENKEPTSDKQPAATNQEVKPTKEKPKRGKSFKWSKVEKFIQNKAKEFGIQYNDKQKRPTKSTQPVAVPNDFSAKPTAEAKAKEPTIDVCDLEKETVIQIEVPGTNKENCNINIDNNVLLFKATVTRSEFMDPSKTRVNQRYYGDYKRSFNLPKNANVKAISAKHENGILTIRIPLEAESDDTNGKLEIE